MLIFPFYFHLSPSSNFYFWHSHLEHILASCLKYLVSTEALGNLQIQYISYCSGCKLGKFCILPFNRSVSSSSTLFDLVHYDAWGASPISIKGGSQYYVSFIEDYTCYCWVYLMKYRYDFLNIYNAFQADVKT